MRPKDRDADKQEKKRELERGGRRRRDRLEGVERVIESIRVAWRPVGANRPISRRPFRAVKSISRSQWNGSYGADSGPSRSNRCRRAIRPFETIAIHSATDRPRPKPEDRHDRFNVANRTLSGYTPTAPRDPSNSLRPEAQAT
jgi:hypothetical protein